MEEECVHVTFSDSKEWGRNEKNKGQWKDDKIVIKLPRMKINMSTVVIKMTEVNGQNSDDIQLLLQP